ncbi:halocyanin domain-containing protein [Natronomonas marina]|jgi:serine/threonine-protein kinase|uniref:halocyanin domain-containing protein n=1 Tax=Natronomonas marina TaxID=2961939 RepID=UPI0020C93E4C|nr:halocyanin domain-containing protein [Natronomonas marina]
MSEFSRRRFVRGTGAALAVGALAGCTGNGGNGGGNGDGSSDVPQAIDDHLSGANGYDGTIADMTGESGVTVMVGAGDGLAFDPAAVRISSSTTVTWEWTGAGGGHNVASVEGSESDFRSGDDFVSEEGHTYEQSFDNTGVQLYVCEPHESQGMKGAIDVVEE